MSDITVKQIQDIEFYQGEHTIPGITFRYAGKQLGVTAWGMNVIEMEAGCTKYPDHDHTKDGHEEVYVVLAGSATITAEGKQIPLTVGSMVRVGPQTKRHIMPGSEGVTILAMGGVPVKIGS